MAVSRNSGRNPRKRLGSTRREPSGPPEPRRLGVDPYAQAIRRAWDSLPELDREFAADRRSAEPRFAELERQPWARRFLLMENSERFQTLGVVELLLGASQNAWTGDTHESEKYAELALTGLALTPSSSHQAALIHDYRARAWSHIANARRIRADFLGAREAFRRAEIFLQSGTGDAGELARWLDLRASLARATRRFDEAELLLRKMIRIHREVGDEHLEGRGLLSLALLRAALGQPEDALGLIELAVARIEGEREPKLRFQAEMNRAACLADLGRTGEARALLPELRRLARLRGSRLDHLRLLWISASIHRDRGRIELAEQALRRVRDGFVAESLPFDAALAALDLAALYLAAGRLDATAELAQETAAIFAALDVRPELLAALALLRQAALKRSATVALVEDLARDMRRRGSSLDPVDAL